MMSFSDTAGRPLYAVNLYSKASLLNSDVHFRRMRDIGPIVWLARSRMWAITRFDEIRSALRACDVLVSGSGIAANSIANRLDVPTTLTSDGRDHARRKTVLLAPMLPRGLEEVRLRLAEEARLAVAEACRAGWIDAMAAIATRLPVSVIAELVGLDEYGRTKMLRWAAKTFDMLGALNFRALLALPTLLELKRYSEGLDRTQVRLDGWAARLFDAAERQEISGQEAAALIIDYVAPSLDTTILATGHLLWLLGTTPGALDRIRADPSLIPGVVNEVVRLASPIRAFTRLALTDHVVDDQIVRKNERVLIAYASGNRDERRFEQPNLFDLNRNPKDHLGWGHGVHTCAGMHIARLELETLLRAIIDGCDRIEVGKSVPLVNNVLQGFQRLTVRLT